MAGPLKARTYTYNALHDSNIYTNNDELKCMEIKGIESKGFLSQPYINASHPTL